MSVIGTAGHVDHGKSALVERLTGINPDRFEEERRRGLTIDLGFTWLTLPSGREIGIIDVPGHARFIENMLAGAGGVSGILFVVAANEGWMPQSTEHLSAIHMLGITSCVIALTKIDLVGDIELERVSAEITERLSGTNLEGAEIVPCSVVGGAGLDALVEALDRALSSTSDQSPDKRARMWIDRSFSIQGAGPVVTGTLAQGTLMVGDQVSVISGNSKVLARIRGLQSHKQAVAKIEPGNRAAVNLVGVDHANIQRGDVLCTKDQWAATDLVSVMATVLNPSLSGHAYELTQKGSHLMFVGSVETTVRIRLLDTDAIAAGESAPAQLQLARSLPLQRGDRFVLRDAGRDITIGGGVVVDPFPELVKRGDGKEAEFIRTLETLEGAEAAALLLDKVGEMSLAEVAIRIGSMDAPKGATTLEDRLVSATRLETLTSLLRKTLTDHHAAHPLERGIPKTSLTAALALSGRACDALLSLVPGVSIQGPLVRLTSHVVDLSPELEQARDRLVEILEESGFSPPPTASLGVDRALVRALEDAGLITRITDFHLTKSQVDLMKRSVKTFIEGGRGATVADIRGLLGTSRKYAIPLCEWMDEVGFTRRAGDLRVLWTKS